MCLCFSSNSVVRALTFSFYNCCFSSLSGSTVSASTFKSVKFRENIYFWLIYVRRDCFRLRRRIFNVLWRLRRRRFAIFFMEDFLAAKLLLCDEFVHDMHLVRHLRDDHHCVLFTTTKCNSHYLQSYFLNSKWDSFQLSFSLRSSGAIANFANNWVNRDELIDTSFSCRPSQNFEGEPNDIVFAKSCDFVPASDRLISLYFE